jgi:hypothetical protein
VLLSVGTEELARISERIQHELLGRVRDFRLDFDSRGLILYGNASCYHEKQLAQHAVLRVTRVPIAANAIVVQ